MNLRELEFHGKLGRAPLKAGFAGQLVGFVVLARNHFPRHHLVEVASQILTQLNAQLFVRRKANDVLTQHLFRGKE